LVHMPEAQSAQAKVSVLSVDSNSKLRLNGYSRIVTDKLECHGTLPISLESDGFESGKMVAVITSVAPLDKNLKVEVSPGYRFHLTDHAITISK
jgi:hypothetical protein